MMSVNEAMRYTSKYEVIQELRKVLPIIITTIAEAPEDKGQNFCRKIDIKDMCYG